MVPLSAQADDQRLLVPPLRQPELPATTAFLGDYSNIAALPAAGVVAYWTGIRNPVSFGGLTLSGEEVYFTTSG